MRVREGIIILALTTMGLYACDAFIKNANAHDWYTGLKNDEGYFCCDKHDFKPVRAWPDDRGIWHALYPDKDGNETEYVIPPEVILPDEFNLEPFQAHLAIVNGLPRCFLRKGAGG